MIFQVLKPVDVDIKYLDVYCGSRVYAEDIQFSCANTSKEYETMEELWADYPSLQGNIQGYNQLYLRIDVETGRVVNWPNDVDADFNDIKVVDEGTYILLDKDNNEIYRYQNYVPSCLEVESNGYGDYFEFVIEDGEIRMWEFTQEHVDELMEVNQED